MSFLDEKTFDIVLEANTDFGYKLTLIKVEEQCTNHPVTNVPINCVEVETPIDVTLFTFTGNISTSLDEGSASQASFTFSKPDPTGGVVQMVLSNTIIKTLLPLASATRDTYNPRVRFLGYYDVMVLDSATNANTRVLQGKVYVSDGVTT